MRDHSDMPAFTRCAALLRNGQPCGRTVSAGSEFCVHHTQLLETIDAESLRQGRIPKKRVLKDPPLRLIVEPSEPKPASIAEAGTSTTNADPATVRPSLAIAAAENVEALKESLLQAAAAATKPTWITVECSGCGERSRIEAPVPDVRARVAAIELLLREGLGRPATAEEVTSPQLPTNVAAIREMSWDEMQALFAAIYVDEIAAAQRDGSEAVLCAKVASLSEGERHVLRQALDEHAA
jgi:hypothetical protein